jgi:two-component system sensor histidine kinase and response regulator WspE
VSYSSGSLGDMSMFDLFRLEAASQSTILSDELLGLEDGSSSVKRLEALMRAAHSLKGAARMVSVDPIVKISHVMEDIFVAAQKDEILLSGNDIDILLSAVDMIKVISDSPENSIGSWNTDNPEVFDGMLKSLSILLTGKVNSNVELAEKAILKDALSADAFLNAMSEGVASGDERTLRVNAERMSKILGIASELLVESRGIGRFKKELHNIKRRQDGLVSLLEGMRELMVRNDVVDDDNQKKAIIQLDECRRSINRHINMLDEYDRKNINLSNKLYHEVAGSRMCPFKDGVVGLKRMVRDLARSLRKEVVLKINGEDCAVDRDVLEKIKSPLNHLLRNAIDHGVEDVERREVVGKPRVAEINLTADHYSGMLRVSVSDDGSGIDVDSLKAKLVSKKLVISKMVDELTNDELLEFLFLPDFSTRENVSEISGRGVGLDVVRDMVKELGGVVTINNHPGDGVEFIMLLPLTLSVISALLVDIAGEPYAFPLSKVDRIIKVSTREILEMEGRQYVSLGNKNIGLISGAQVLGFESLDIDEDQLTVVIVSDRLDQYGVVVDRYIDQKQLSVHAIDARLGKVPNVSSSALMENGDPLFILDVDDMVRSINHIVTGGRLGDVYQVAEEKLNVSRKRVLVVDDSLTVREVEKGLLEAKGYLVDVAVDGMDGWNAVRRSSYDLIITDVDMPRMDGIELVSMIKHDLHLKSLPVMIVSYKDRIEDRRRGLEAGADYYLTKGSFQDDTLIEAVEDLIGEAFK